MEPTDPTPTPTPVPTAVLYVDISGSTAYFDRHGEQAGHAMVERCLGIIIPQVESRRGRIVKNLGDGFLAVFEKPADLVAASAAACMMLAASNESLPAAARVRIHCGGDFGPAVFTEDGDVFGDVANVGARVQALAGPDQIFVTADLANSLSPEDRLRLRQLGKFPLRGKEEEIEIHEVVWQEEGSTVLFSRKDMKIESRLTLFVQGRVVEFPADKSKLTIGRVETNDVAIEDAAVSREHAQIARRRGWYYFVDRSTNGTYLRPEGKSVRHLHRDELQLEGTGSFSLGRPDGPAVEYKVT